MGFLRQINQLDAPTTIPVDRVKFDPPSGLSVLVVGAGVGGLFSALECRRKGHSVRVIERYPSLSTAGDSFSIGTHIIRHLFLHWPDLAEHVESINDEAMIAYHKITGERVSGPEPITFAELEMTLPDGTPKLLKFHRQNRPKFVGALLAQARGAGIDVKFGQHVVDYVEDPAEGNAAAVLNNGDMLKADVVVAADGLGTKSTKLVRGQETRAYPSGFSIFRTAFPVELAIEDPDIAERWPLLDGVHPVFELWRGANNLTFSVQRTKDLMTWHMMHKSTGVGMESWSQRVDVSKVFEITSQIPGFPEIAERLIKKTPAEGLVDWELMWRDPSETWISPHGRVVQVGDAAHAFLPSSGSGATQAIEDAISLAACLAIGKRENVVFSTKVHNKLRFQRVSCAQLLGFINHQRQHSTGFEVEDEDGNSFKSFIGKWSFHDPEQYAYDNYGKALSHLQTGVPFESTNIPPGYTYKPWTIQDMFQRIESGEILKFDGDWS